LSPFSGCRASGTLVHDHRWLNFEEASRQTVERVSQAGGIGAGHAGKMPRHQEAWEMRERTWTLATIVTMSRLALLPVLWRWALFGKVAWVGVGVTASLLADILDGQLARRLNQVTKLGSRLDSVADALLVGSSAVWLVWFRPEVLQGPHLAVAALAIGTWLLSLGLGLVRFRRFSNLHLYSAKASAVVGAIFVLDALVFGFHAPLFYAAFGAFSLANMEELLVMLTRSQVDEHIGSFFRRPAAIPVAVTR